MAALWEKIKSGWKSAKSLGWKAWSFIGIGSFDTIEKVLRAIWRLWGDEQNGISLFDQAGGSVPLLVNLVESWWLPLFLIPLGLAYGIFVEKTDHVKNHPWIPKLAVVAIVTALILMISTSASKLFCPHRRIKILHNTTSTDTNSGI